MPDFDFDEIDRAVSGALGRKAPRSVASRKPVVTLEESEVIKVNTGIARPSVGESVSDEVSVAELSIQPAAESDEPRPVIQSVASQVQYDSGDTVKVSRQAPAVRRSSGRFMDVVHPSSDMRGRNDKAERPVASRPISDSIGGAEARPGFGRSANDSDVVEDTTLASFTEEDAVQPLGSPFLADAKIEKRPLGGEPGVGAAQFKDSLPADVTNQDESLGGMPDPIDFSTSFMDDAPDYSKESSFSMATPDYEQTGLVEPSVSVELDSPALGAIEPQAIKPEEQSIGPTSITQQYTERPGAEQVSGSIYDTEAYHQPLTQPVKKRSGVWVVLWIILLVIFGAGAGAAFYIFVLPII